MAYWTENHMTESVCNNVEAGQGGRTIDIICALKYSAVIC
jgi:hypothetical protein